MFAYCNNNPVSNSDPSGHWLVEAIAAVAIVTGLLLSGCSANQYGAAKRYKETSSPNFNCYAYALRETEWRYVGGYPEAVTDYNVENVAAMVMDDVKASGRSIRPLESFDSPIEQNEYRIALRTGVEDYHFMIQHSDGSWSHKPSWLPSRLADGNNPSDMSWDLPYFDTNKYGLLQLMYHENYYDSATLYFAISP